MWEIRLEDWYQSFPLSLDKKANMRISKNAKTIPLTCIWLNELCKLLALNKWSQKFGNKMGVYCELAEESTIN